MIDRPHPSPSRFALWAPPSIPCARDPHPALRATFPQGGRNKRGSLCVTRAINPKGEGLRGAAARLLVLEVQA